MTLPITKSYKKLTQKNYQMCSFLRERTVEPHAKFFQNHPEYILEIRGKVQ